MSADDNMPRVCDKEKGKGTLVEKSPVYAGHGKARAFMQSARLNSLILFFPFDRTSA